MPFSTVYSSLHTFIFCCLSASVHVFLPNRTLQWKMEYEFHSAFSRLALGSLAIRTCPENLHIEGFERHSEPPQMAPKQSTNVAIWSFGVSEHLTINLKVNPDTL